MIARLCSWWQKKRKPLGRIGIIAVSIGVAVLIFVVVRSSGTGFTGKTLWDWLQLLGALAIPVVVGFGAAWFTRVQQQSDQQLARQQHDHDQVLAEQQAKSEREAAEKRAQTEHEIALDNQREAALQAYIDNMSELLLAQNIGNASADEEGQKLARVRTLLDLHGVPIRSGPREAQKIARIRTLTVLWRLDAERKGSVLLFLHESGLIDKDKCTIDLSGADLSEAKLSSANLSHVNLSGARLRGADLSSAWLSQADLSQADLSHANLWGVWLGGADLSSASLSGANLSSANLSGASVTPEQLDEALSLKDTILPDGSKHP